MNVNDIVETVIAEYETAAQLSWIEHSSLIPHKISAQDMENFKNAFIAGFLSGCAYMYDKAPA